MVRRKNHHKSNALYFYVSIDITDYNTNALSLCLPVYLSEKNSNNTTRTNSKLLGFRSLCITSWACKNAMVSSNA